MLLRRQRQDLNKPAEIVVVRSAEPGDDPPREAAGPFLRRSPADERQAKGVSDAIKRAGTAQRCPPAIAAPRAAHGR